MFREFGAAFLSGTTATVKGEYLVEFRNLAIKSFETMHNNNIDLIAVMLRNESWESAKVADQVGGRGRHFFTIEVASETPYRRTSGT